MPRPTRDLIPTARVTPSRCRCGKDVYVVDNGRAVCDDCYIDRLAAAWDAVFYDRGDR